MQQGNLLESWRAGSDPTRGLVAVNRLGIPGGLSRATAPRSFPCVFLSWSFQS